MLLLAAFFPIFSAPQPRTSMVSYNPFPGNTVHAPLSTMALIAISTVTSGIEGIQGVNGSSGSPSATLGQGGPVTIPQNTLRFINDTSYFPQGETSISVDPANTRHVVGGFNDLKYFFCPFLPGDCASSGSPGSIAGFTVSVDGGASVLKGSDLPNLGLDSVVNYGDPSVAASLDGNFFYSNLAFSLRNFVSGVVIAKSNSSLFNPNVSCVSFGPGQTLNSCWKLVLASSTLSSFPASLEDKPLIAVDHAPKDKFTGSVYIAWTHVSFAEGKSTISMSRCDAALASCIPLAGGPLPPLSGNDEFADFATPSVDAAGNVYVAWCNYGTFNSYGPIVCKMRSSPPGGTGFGATSTILSFDGLGSMLPNDLVTIGFATEQFRTFSIPYLAVDQSPRHGPGSMSTSGNLYFTIQVCISGRYIALREREVDNPGICGLSAILVSRSIDSGTTWSQPITVSQPAVNAQPTLAVDPFTGDVFVSYYTTQFDPFNHRLDVVVSKSTDGGQTYTQTRITTVSSEPDSDPNMFFYPSPFGGSWVTPQIGDYFQAIAISGTLWVLFTANYAVEAGTFQSDPFLATLTV